MPDSSAASRSAAPARVASPRLAVAAELEPPPGLGVQGQQHRARRSAESTSALAVRWSGWQERCSPSGCALEVRRRTPRRSASCAASARRQRPQRRERVVVQRGHGVGWRPSGLVVAGSPASLSSSSASAASNSASVERLGRSDEPSRKPSGSSRSAEVGQQVGVRPDRVAGLLALAGAQRAPQRRGVAQPARPQLEADQRGERLLGRTAGGAAAADGLLQLARRSASGLGGLADDLVDPALDQRERGLEADQRGLLRRGLLAARTARPRAPPGSRPGWSGRCRASTPRCSDDVDGGAAAVVLDRGEQVRAQPRHVREQPLVGGLAQREVEQHVVVGHVEALGERGDVGRAAARPCRPGPSGQADVGGAEHLAGEPAERLPDLAAEHRAAGLAEHPDQRAGHRLGLLGHRVAHRGHDVLGDRLDEHLPDRRWSARPTRRGSRPRWSVTPAGQLGRGVEPVVGEPQRVGDAGAVARSGIGVGLLRRRCGGRCPWRGSSSPRPRAAASSPASGPSAPTGRACPPPPASPAAAAAPPTAEGVEDLLEGRALERVGLLVVRTVAGLVRHAPKLLAAPNRRRRRREYARPRDR